MFYAEVTSDIDIFGKVRRPAGIYKFEHRALIPFTVTSHADRIWQESEEGVCWIKNRWGDDQPVDMKEFFWAKLQAK